jgi:hypothetical protein
MREFKGFIKTDKVGSLCEFKFEVENDASDTDIEEIAKECAFELIEWNYEEVSK